MPIAFSKLLTPKNGVLTTKPELAARPVAETKASKLASIEEHLLGRSVDRPTHTLASPGCRMSQLTVQNC